VVKILEAITQLSGELAADIPLAKTREEHIRVTARANAALELLNMLTDNGLDPIPADEVKKY
jgi:hypothetical protein